MSSRKQKIIVIAIASAILILTIFSSIYKFPFDFSSFYKGEEVSQKIKKLYELTNPGLQIEVVSVSEESGMYRIILRINQANSINYQEIYVTKDGKLLSLVQNTIKVDELLDQAKRLKIFIDCLETNNVKIYGLSNDTATILQFNILGRLISSYPLKLFVPCDGNLVQNCLLANVSIVPSVVIYNRVEPGIKDISWFERETKCKF